MERVSIRPAVGIALASAVLAIGCSAGRPTTSSPESPPGTSLAADATTTAIDRLKAGTAFIDQVSFAATVVITDGELTFEARTDNVNKRAAVTVTTPANVTQIRMIGDAVYLASDPPLSTAPKGWMILDPAKVPASFAPSFDRGKNDPGGSARLINAITSAQVTGSEVSGTIDLVKIGTGNGISFRFDPGSTVPDSARRQEFRAALDSQGRLTSFAVLGSQGVPRARLEYRGFGTAVTVSRPPAAVPAPDTVYPLLGLR
ncbi:hypothetical protein GCM10022251_34750 [Phytohabitans flavus]|uniref:LppX_LprAFG lipoprotein n=1 Tax=Phytohabitans flavus TaxID=1076124 RepID=A0A6F8XMZ0_9ACTN|nr:hypothetical protein [Phytohabitans flavus]BCB75167.1 hypothetical protein Pflav_015770 [Phytohabitans flavus]